MMNMNAAHSDSLDHSSETSDLAKEYAVKLAFAESWLRFPKDPLKAAMEITLGDSLLAIHISTYWVHDATVREMKAELLNKYGEEHFLPSKATLIHDILHRAEHASDCDYAKLMKLVADMRGMSQQNTGNNVTINNTVNQNRVMFVPQFLNASGQPIDSYDWEKMAVTQQKALTVE